MSVLPQAQLGVFIFSSGRNPEKIDGPKKINYVIEHENPGREGAMSEYLGSRQSTYRLQGILAPLLDPVTGPAAATISGTSAILISPANAINFLANLRGSGVHLLRLESTWTRLSGYPILYENDFFYIVSETFAFIPEKAYDDYRYTIDLVRASTRTYGNSSGTQTYNPANIYMSGYVLAWQQRSGLAQGETISALGLYASTVASGNAQMALYNTSLSLLAQSISQPVNSGWNYFPMNPSFTTTSGTSYIFAVMGDATSTSGYSVPQFDVAFSGSFSFQSGVSYSAGFPNPLAPGSFANVSGNNLNLQMIVAG